MSSQAWVDERPDRQGLPGATNRDVAFLGLPQNPESLLSEAIYPEDAYKGTTSWADLPTKERTIWINQQHNQEAARELHSIWQAFRQDPFKPFNNTFATMLSLESASSRKDTSCSALATS